MPAVDPSQLRFQVAKLLDAYGSPENFRKELNRLFSFYANRTLRFGELADDTLLIQAYRLPEPVMRQIKLDLKPLITENPTLSLSIADELWEEEIYEVRQVAIFILGQAEVNEPDPILTRLKNWLSPALDRDLKEKLLTTGTQKLRSSFPKRWEAWIESLLGQQDVNLNTIGLMGLRAELISPIYRNLPAIFRLISPYVRDPRTEIFKELTRLIEVLIKHSPNETGYFLKQALSLSNSQITIRLIKGCLPLFPETIRQSINEVLKAK